MTIARRGNFIIIGNKFIQANNIDMLVNDGHMVKIHLSGGHTTHVSPDGTGELHAETNKIYNQITDLLYDQP